MYAIGHATFRHYIIPVYVSRHVCVWIDIDVHWLSRHCRVHNLWLESDRRPLILAIFQPVVTETHITTGQLLKYCWSTLWTFTSGEAVVWRGVVEPSSTQGFRLSSESADQTRHWHCVRAVEQTFIVVLAAAIYATVVAVEFAVLPSLNAPLLVFALLFVTLPFSPVC